MQIAEDPHRPYEVADEMDYQEHEGTYDAFLELTKLTVVGVLNVLLCLILFTYGSFWLGALVLLLLLAAVGLGLAQGLSWKPSGYVFGLAALFVLFSTLG